jgi:hypothetical protein
MDYPTKNSGVLGGRQNSAYAMSALALLAFLGCGSTTGNHGGDATSSVTPSSNLPALPDDGTKQNHIGLNTWFLDDWDGSFAFVDVVKHARPWQDAADWHNPVGGVDELGWPTADASTVFFTGTPAQVNGTYTLVFHGQADISLLWAAGSVSDQKWDPNTNITTAKVTFAVTGDSGSHGLVLRNTKRKNDSATGTGFTDLHLYRPGYPDDGSQVFTKPFLAALGKVQTVRLKDWSATDVNMVRHWSERRTPSHMAISGANDPGVALEHQIQLCNTLLVDCWINIPVLADDEYVRNVALALRFGTDGTNPYTSTQAHPAFPPLDPSLRIYIEYANEIWNSSAGFQCFGKIYELVGQLEATHPLKVLASDNEYQLMWRYPAWRMMTISEIFRNVYGNDSMMNRVRPLLMTQQGNGQDTLAQALLWLDDYARNPEKYGRKAEDKREISYYLFGAGGSGYYDDPKTRAPDDYFKEGSYPVASSVQGMGVDAVWAANWGLRRIAYEGGPSLDGATVAEANVLNLDDRMETVVEKTHKAWSSVGGDLLVYYVLVGPADWEFMNDVNNLTTPKMRALIALNNASTRDPVTLGAELPGSMVATDNPNYRIRTGFDYNISCGGSDCVGGNDPGEWVALAGHAKDAFKGRVSFSGTSGTGSSVTIWVNGKQEGTVRLPAQTSGSLDHSDSVVADIPAGLVVIRLEVKNGGDGGVSGKFDLRSIDVTL